MKPYSGVVPAVVTPFNNDYEIDEIALSNLIEDIVEVDLVDSLLMNGHTGEILSLTPEERMRTIEIARKTVGEDMLIMAGVHGQSTAETINAINDAEKAGANSVMVFSPFSFSRGAFQYPEVVVQYYQDIADETNLPFFVMQYPPNSNMMMPLSTLLEVAKIDKVIGVKEAVGDIVRYEQDYRALKKLDKTFTFLTASEGALYTTFSIGCDGAIIGIGNIAKPVSSLLKAFRNNDLEEAKRINEIFYPLSQSIYSMPSFRWSTRLKYALYKLGKIPNPTVRKPLQPLTSEEKVIIDQAVENYLKQEGEL